MKLASTQGRVCDTSANSVVAALICSPFCSLHVDGGAAERSADHRAREVQLGPLALGLLLAHHRVLVDGALRIADQLGGDALDLLAHHR